MNLKNLARYVFYVGMAVCMIGGATWPAPQWFTVIVGLAVLGCGIAIKRRADRAAPEASEDGSTAGTFASAVAAMPVLRDGLRALEATAVEQPLTALAQALEELQRKGIDVVAGAQDDFVRLHGFVPYAAVMAPLATGERLLHRAWSAASDGHRPEALASIRAAIPHIASAGEALDRVTGHPGQTTDSPPRA